MALLIDVAGLVGRLDAAAFGIVLAPVMTASIGAHARHLLDHYDSLLLGLPTRRVDYENRRRNPLVESDHHAARQELLRIAGFLHVDPVFRADCPLQVRDGAILAGGWAHSTLERELGFLLSHTTHHCALIAATCRLQGIAVNASFGLAPSTLRHLSALRDAQAS